MALFLKEQIIQINIIIIIIIIIKHNYYCVYL